MNNPENTKFKITTIDIDIKKLENETNDLFFLGLLIAICFHVVLFFYTPQKMIVKKDENNIPVELIIQPPRKIQPLIISKKSTSSTTYKYRKKSMPGKPSEFVGKSNQSIIESLEGQNEILLKEDYLNETEQEDLPDSIVISEKLFRMPKDKIPFSSNLFVDKGDIQSSKSMIITPPGNKMAIQGYTHIASIRGEEFSPPDILLNAFDDLAKAVNYYTNIGAKCDSRINLSNEIFKYPLIYICNDKPIELTKAEKDLLAEYISSGGFIIIDNPFHEADRGLVGNSLKNAYVDAFTLRRIDSCSESGKIYSIEQPEFYEGGFLKKGITTYKKSGMIPSRTFKPLPQNHELFHCFFDFNNGPPVEYREDTKTNNIIEGIYLNERLIGFYVVGYGLSWNDKRNEEKLKMGVNMVVYALRHGKGHYNYKTGKMLSFNQGNLKIW
jgi:hypothetical protein